MNWKRLVYLILASIIILGVAYPSEVEAAKKRKSKARTTQTTKKKSKKRSNKRRSSSSSSRKRTAPAAPKETVYNDSLTLLVNEALIRNVDERVNPGGLRVNQARPDRNARSLSVQLNESFTYLPVSRDLISTFENTLKEALPDSVADFAISFNVGAKPYSSYITTIDKLPEEFRRNVPFVVAANPYVHPVKGM